jgi:hypothetical protein
MDSSRFFRPGGARCGPGRFAKPLKLLVVVRLFLKECVAFRSVI